MDFKSPEVLLILPLIMIFIFLLALWGWRVKKETLEFFRINREKAKKSHIKKYAVIGAIFIFLCLSLAQPNFLLGFTEGQGKIGSIALVVDVTESMKAQKTLDSPSRLERIKSLLLEIVDNLSGQDSYSDSELKVSLHGMTSIARSLVPFVSREDFPYLKKSIKEVLDIHSVPGEGTNLGSALLDVLRKFPEEKNGRLLILFSDGEFFSNQRGLKPSDQQLLDTAIRQALQEKIKIIAIGVGEKEGATIPIYNLEGNFSGDYARQDGRVYITYLEEEVLSQTALRTGGKYFQEKDKAGLIRFINDNLETSISSQKKEYQDAGIWFLIPAAVLFIIFARYYLR